MWLRLYMIFFKIGLVTIGGGYTMLPIIERELVVRHRLAGHDAVLDSFAMAQSIPGIVAVNTATLLGYRIGKTSKAIACFLGVITPSIIIISLIALAYGGASRIPWIEKALQGVRVAVLALLMVTVWRLLRRTVRDWFQAAVAGGAFLALLLFPVSPIAVIVGGGAASVCYYRWREGGSHAG
ncbi:chromate transporter [Anaerotalea alkaliphila]|nr:chromate transporter [Anaerotalea alkaliphila]